MASKRTHDVSATIGEYTNGAGETKKRYTNCGSAFTDDQGRISIKLDTVPVGPEWSGWLSLYPVKDRDDRGGQQQPAPARPQPRNHSIPSERQAAREDEGGFDDDSTIPF